MEQKESNFNSGRRYNRMGPDRLARSLSELYMMTNATAHWKGSRYLNYDYYDACIRSFMNWLRYVRPTLTILATAGFFYVGITYIKYKIHCPNIQQNPFSTYTHMKIPFL